MTTGKEKSQFALLATQRFAPFFWTQFMGAFNDNVFKNALILLIAYQGTAHIVNADVLINAAAGLFILPYFLFSATAGQLADKYEKSKLIQWIKLFEISIMLIASVGFFTHNLILLMFLLFCMGVHSAFFGPAKYSIIPQHLKADEIVGGNALVEMGTFIAILLGTILGGVLIQQKNGEFWVSAAVFAIALVGWLSSRKIPLAEPPSPELTVNWNPFTQIWTTIRFSRRVHSVFLSILAISWFWFIGAAYLTQLPNFTKQVLRSSESVVTLILTMFSVGVGVGSLLCERLSGKKVELGLVPLGSIGLSIFGIDLFFAYTPPVVQNLMGIREFFQTPGSFRLLADLVLIGVFGGFYTVPLYAFIQVRTDPEYRARMIAATNIMGAIFMVVSSIMGAVMLGVAKMTTLQFFLTLALMNIAVAAYIYTVVPEFVVRFLIWIFTHTFYRVRHIDLDNIPDEGPAVLVSNHVSFMDGPIIAGACRRPIRFVMFEPIYRLPVLNFIFRTGKAIPIDSQRTAPETYHKALESVAQALNEGELVCIFPEGKLTEDGEIDVFKPGIERILENNPVPVVPLALRGLWGSFFSKKLKMSRFSGRFWSKIEVAAGTPLAPEGLKAEKLREIVKELRGN